MRIVYIVINNVYVVSLDFDSRQKLELSKWIADACRHNFVNNVNLRYRGHFKATTFDGRAENNLSRSFYFTRKDSGTRARERERERETSMTTRRLPSALAHLFQLSTAN